MIGILKIENSGNLFSLKQALEFLNCKYFMINNLSDINDCEKIIIPGVGSYSNAMGYLNSNYNIQKLTDTLSNKPVLGICVGMQILSEFGYENKKTKGLGLIKGSIKKINTKRVLPHVGFNSVIIENKTKLFSNIDELESKFYFTHSFELILKTNTTSFCMYHEKKIISSIEKDNIIGVQFHPENSRRQGIKLIDNFINKY